MSGLFKKSIEGLKRQKEIQEEEGQGENQRIGGIDFDELSSSEQEKLRERGIFRKKIHKTHKPTREEGQWKRGRVVREHRDHKEHREYRRSDRPAPNHSYPSVPPSNSYKVAFTLTTPKVQASDIYNLLNSYKIFIQELKLSYPTGRLSFSRLQAAQKSCLLLSPSAITFGATVENQPLPVGQNRHSEDIFNRFK